MMSDYTPDDIAVLAAYRFHVRAIDNARYAESGREPMSDEEILDEFDRYLANLKAEAWDEGFNVSENNIMDTPNPYRTVKDN